MIHTEKFNLEEHTDISETITFSFCVCVCVCWLAEGGGKGGGVVCWGVVCFLAWQRANMKSSHEGKNKVIFVIRNRQGKSNVNSTTLGDL